MTVSSQRKNSEQTKTVSNSQKIRFHQLELSILLKNTFLLDGKSWQESLKSGEKKWFPLAGKSVSPTMNKLLLAGIFLKIKFRLISIMVSTNRKKALKSVSISRNKVFKNWIPPNFHYQEQGYFLKIWFFLISIMVSTSRNKSCKILFCLGEIVFLYWEFFASGNHYRNMEANF